MRSPAGRLWRLPAVHGRAWRDPDPEWDAGRARRTEKPSFSSQPSRMRRLRHNKYSGKYSRAIWKIVKSLGSFRMNSRLVGTGKLAKYFVVWPT